jgi:hypothetical protein
VTAVIPHEGYDPRERPVYRPCPRCLQLVRADRADLLREHWQVCDGRRLSMTVGKVTVTLGEVAMVVIAVFVVLAYFNGWG